MPSWEDLTGRADTTPLPPSQDPFYTAPDDYKAASPGDVLRFRTARNNVCSIVANCSEAYSNLYRTTDGSNGPSWALATLLIPRHVGHIHDHASGHALLSYQIAYDTAAIDGSPSYLLYDPSQNTTLLDMTAALGRGWFVNVPDYEGPLAAFGLGLQAGYATLDSIRAVLQVARDHKLGLYPNARYAMWGYSGGSIASEWAAELQRSYAPDLNFAGLVAGGVVARLESTIELVSGIAFAALIPSLLVGTTTEFSEVRQALVASLKSTGPYNATAFLAANQMPFGQAATTYAMQNISDYFTDGAAGILSPSIVNLINTQGVMGEHGVPGMPTFFYKAIADEIAPTRETDARVDKYCQQGAKILYERNEIGDHETELQNGHTRALDWLSSVYHGTYAEFYDAGGCIIRNVSVVDPTGPTAP